MNNKEIRKLTVAVIRVTESFRGGDVLKNRIQEKALDIFAKSNPHFDETIVKDVKLLKRFINLAKDLQLTKSVNCEVLVREYNKIYEMMIDDFNPVAPAQSIFNDNVSASVVALPQKSNSKKHVKEKKKNYKKNANSVVDLTARQRKILGLVVSKDELQLREIIKSFPDITPRTLRNDLRGLVEMGRLRRKGVGAGSAYVKK